MESRDQVKHVSMEVIQTTPGTKQVGGVFHGSNGTGRWKDWKERKENERKGMEGRKKEGKVREGKAEKGTA